MGRSALLQTLELHLQAAHIFEGLSQRVMKGLDDLVFRDDVAIGGRRRDSRPQNLLFYRHAALLMRCCVDGVDALQAVRLLV